METLPVIRGIYGVCVTIVAPVGYDFGTASAVRTFSNFRTTVQIAYNLVNIDAISSIAGNAMRLRTFHLTILSLAGLTSVSLGDDAADATFFETKVRPLLIAKCVECHSGEKSKAGLRLDSREALLTGGESGPALVVGKPDESLLIDVIGYRNAVQMPPKAKLPDAEIAILTDWVRRGASWPNSKPSVTTPANVPPTDFTDEQKAFWAFQPVRRESPPEVNNPTWLRSAIDAFIHAELDGKGLVPAREADRRTLLRRVTLNLIGMPPTPEELDDFLVDPAADALERVVDRLLASPRYGERWARHWLDVARYADSNGLDENLAYANAYRYRDYVVKAMREDKPYDRFLVEQIAGDLLEPDADINPGSSVVRDDSFDELVATGFLCLGAKMLAEDDPVKMQMDIIDEQVDTVARAFMGLTMGCARCHDHKYDPLTTDDYYGLAGVFKSTQTMDTFTVVARWHERRLATPDQERQRNELQQLADQSRQAMDKLKADITEKILDDARTHAVAYLLAATRELQLADRLKAAKPRGEFPTANEIPGAHLIEAEDFVRGNVQKDRETYGREIGVLVNRGETPNFAEYEVETDTAGLYQFELRYAAASSRPVKLLVNGTMVKTNVAGQVTGSWGPETQTWFVESFVSLNAGRNVLRLEQPQFFPHIDKLLLTPADATDAAWQSTTGSTISSGVGEPRLIASITQQWIKALQESRNEPDSILTAWNQFLSDRQLTAKPAATDKGVVRLLGETQPGSLAELAHRYEQLFAETMQSWRELTATDKEAQLLPDPVLEDARKLLFGMKGPFKVPKDVEAFFPAEVVRQLTSLRDELNSRELAIPKYPETMAVADAKPENLKIHLRGSHLTLGREVSRHWPRVLKRRDEPNDLMDGSGRLQLARWLANADHPLTSRVMVNRLWQWHFGQGLVRSPDNFGRLGERPSHPALLDWLADEFSGRRSAFRDNPRSWSLKAVHRLLISSSVYRQSTQPNATAALIDPENRLLWRFHRQRMDAEVLRDSLLSLGGRLDETPGGTLLPTANRAYVTSTANVNPEIYNSSRRSIYLPVVRSALFEVFTAFDFADPSTLMGQRDQTTVAPQALFLMNSGFVLDQVRNLAKRLLDQTDLDQPGRIRYLYQLCYCRNPSEAEVDRAIGYLDRVRLALMELEPAAVDIDARIWTSLCRAVLSANEFLYTE
jgi:hypothetical protein